MKGKFIVLDFASYFHKSSGPNVYLECIILRQIQPKHLDNMQLDSRKINVV